jgi:uncharacterized protein (AIM24 family)
MDAPGVPILERARELFDGGLLAEAEALLGAEEGPGSRDPSILGFRAYLLYRLGRLSEAEQVYRDLTAIVPSDHSALSNLGVVLLKEGKVREARAAFEEVLRLAPGDSKALRNLGYCSRRIGEARRPAEDPAGGGAAGGPQKDSGGEAPLPLADGAGIGEWMSESSLPFAASGREIIRVGPGAMVLRLDEKIYLNRRFITSHRGMIVFSSASRQANRAARKFGPRGGIVLRAEGSGEVALSGRGASLRLFRVEEEELWVNYPCLAACGSETALSFSFQGLRKGLFLGAGLQGADLVVLALRGSPVILELPGDLPAYVLPEAVAAWTGNLTYEREDIPLPGTGLLGRRRESHLRFEGKGHLLLQDLGT